MSKGYPDTLVPAGKAAATAAIHAAAAAAGKSGWRTSEFWVTIAGAAASAGLAIALANPIGLVAAGAVAAGVAVYSASRGNVKAAMGAAAINAIGAVAKEVPGPVGEAAAVVGAVVTAAAVKG